MKGTFLVPIFKYGSGGSDKNLVGKLCTVLGYERGGVYANKYNFFGGKVDVGVTPVDNLLKETEEELCLALSDKLLDRCVLGASMVGKTMFVFAHIKGISTRKWNMIMFTRRLNIFQPWSRVEMSDIAVVPIADLATFKSTSSFVQSSVGLVQGHAAKVDNAIKAGDVGVDVNYPNDLWKL